SLEGIKMERFLIDLNLFFESQFCERNPLGVAITSTLSLDPYSRTLCYRLCKLLLPLCVTCGRVLAWDSSGHQTNPQTKSTVPDAVRDLRKVDISKIGKPVETVHLAASR